MSQEALTVPIADVGREAWKRSRPAFFAMLGLAAIMVGLIATVDSLLFVSVHILALPLIIYLGVFAFYHISLQRQFMMQFAAANGFSFREKANLQEFKGTLFTLGYGREARNVVMGDYKNCPFTLLNYTFKEGSGKQTRVYHVTLAEARIGGALPNIFLESSRLLWSGFRPLPKRASKATRAFASNPKKVHLEERWDKLFDLYAPEDYEAEAFQIFTPEVLGILENCYKSGFRFAVELTEDRCYLYLPGKIGNAKKLNAVYTVLGSLLERVGPELARMQRGLEAQKAVFSR